MYHFIINPTASSGASGKTWRKLKRILDKEEVAYKAHILQGPQDAIRLTQKLTGAGEEVHLIVIGGDGTLNEVLNGIQNFETTCLSCIKSGSGNDFARSMKIISDPVKALFHILKSPEEERIEFGEAVYTPWPGGDSVHRRFLISCGVGYDADICAEVEKSPLKPILNRIHLGKLIYLTVGLLQIFFRKPAEAILTITDGVGNVKQIPLPGGLFLVVGMVQPMEGGGVPFCPDADPTDGLLSTCLITHMPKWKLLPAVMLVYQKKHYLFSNITAHKCVSMEIEVKEPQWIHLDGDAPCQIRKVQWNNCKSLRFIK